MSQELINRSPDLKRLQDEGYEIGVWKTYLMIQHVPYVTSQMQVAYGTLVSTLTMAGDRIVKPDTHVVSFIGQFPCKHDGAELLEIGNKGQKMRLAEGLEVDFQFSSKPNQDGYPNYYDKMTSYIRILEGHAQALDSSVTARTYKAIPMAPEESVFNYFDTASSRAEITALSERLSNQKIAIVGLGGSGSYVLDFVAKTPVKEIHLYDSDKFLSHNAFRAPGAASLAALNAEQCKVDYLAGVFRNMRKGIFTHPENITASNVNELSSMSFVFLCVDKGAVKKLVAETLGQTEVPFIDLGIGVTLADDKLLALVRTTISTPSKHENFAKRVGFDDGADGEYDKNIQIAELNALNAAFAVIKWKQWSGFYHDSVKEHCSIYALDTNQLISEDFE